MSIVKGREFKKIFIDDVPILDVRAPVEFAKGAFSSSVNVPLLNDAQREQVGIEYAHEGHDAAVALGAKLIKGDVKQARVNLWVKFMQDHPNGVVACFRGGMRSKIVQQWVFDETGMTIPRIEGGYKALRRFLMDQTVALSQQVTVIILSGRTGSGKTLLLKKLTCAIDLESLANHRGSSIGRQISPQPTQITFENNVAVLMLKHSQQNHTQLILEDESPNIGSLHIPHALYDKMSASSCVMLNTPFTRRVDIILQEYVAEMLSQYVGYLDSEEKGFIAFGDYLQASLLRVKRRLGSERFQQVQKKMTDALKIHGESGNTDLHRDWIQCMLKNYYDPMYDYQRDKRQRKIIFEGDAKAIMIFMS